VNAWIAALALGIASACARPETDSARAASETSSPPLDTLVSASDSAAVTPPALPLTGDLADSTDFTIPGLEPPLDSAQLRSRLGAPTHVEVQEHPFDTGARLATWFYPGLEAMLNSDGVLTGGVLIDSTRATRRGLRVGHSLSRVFELYGPHEDGAREVFDYRWAQMDLRVIRVHVAQGRVTRIYVGWLLD